MNLESRVCDKTVADAEEAIAVANSTSYGLSAGLLTSDTTRGLALARRII